MGSGFSRLLFPCCFSKTAHQNQNQDLFFPSGPLDETLGHSFCYVRSSARFLSPSHSDRISPSHSLRLSPSHDAAASSKTRSGFTETAFKSISGASVSANTSTPRTVLLNDHIYDNATDSNTTRFNNLNGFESSSSFSAIPLQPVPRTGPLDMSGPLDHAFFMSGPIERGALSGPLDGTGIHFSAPLGGNYVKKKRRKGFSGVRKAIHRSFLEKKRPWVVPVLNFVGRKESTSVADSEPFDLDSKTEGQFGENVQWAHGKAGEDRVHVVVSEEHGWLFVGIYDGFNGPDAPEFLMGNLYRAIFKELEGLFWETQDDSSLISGQDGEEGKIENLENVEVNVGRDQPLEPENKQQLEQGQQDGEECNIDLPPRPLDCGAVKRVTFQSEQIGPRRGKTLWEFLTEQDEDDGLDLSGSDRFTFSVDKVFRVNNASSVVSKRSQLFAKLKYGFNAQKESQRKLFPWRHDWEDKEIVEVENRVAEESSTRRNYIKRKVGPIDHRSVLRALSRALEVTELAYLEMTDKVLDRNPELALMGSCLLATLMKDEDVYVMNVGDSRAIVAQHQTEAIDSSMELSGKGHDGLDSDGIVEAKVNQVAVEAPDQIMKLMALQLSTDHSTSIEEEVLRIKEEHPDDNQCIVNDRVKGRLKVTRAFGAGFLKQPKLNNALLEMFRNEYIGTAPYISCSPSLCHHKLGPNDQFLVLSSDGLYQYLSNQEVVSHVETFMEKFPDGDPAQNLIEELLFRAAQKAGMDFHELLDIPQGDRRKYHDDVTVMIISLEGRIWKSSGKYL